MRKRLEWSAALVGALGFACSEEGGRMRENVTGSAVAQAGSGGGASASAGGGSGGLPGAAGSGGEEDGIPRGDALEFVAGTGNVPYAIGPNPYGIRGGGFLARAALGNTVSVGNEPGQICISGNLEEVPTNPGGGGNYGQYWGVEFGFNLNQGVPEGGGAAPPPPASDAGADAGDAAAPVLPPAMEVAQAWQLGNVVGFSFVIEGPTIPLIRFKGLPAGADRTLESSVYCKEVSATTGDVQNALFTEMDQYCWGPTVNALLPTSGGLDNISWQLPADVAPAGARPFDLCLKNLRPILAQ